MNKRKLNTIVGNFITLTKKTLIIERLGKLSVKYIPENVKFLCVINIIIKSNSKKSGSKLNTVLSAVFLVARSIFFQFCLNIRWVVRFRNLPKRNGEKMQLSGWVKG